MSRLLSLFLSCLFFVQAGYAQQAGNGVQLSHYIFDQFSKGTVHFKSGSIHEEELNYNSLTSEMVFNDHGKYLAIDNANEIDTVTIGSRQFVPAAKGFYELLLAGPFPLFMEYTCTIKDPGADIGFGMKTTTSATTQLKSLIQSGGAYELKLPDGFEPVPGHDFLILRDGKFLPANNARQLGTALPEKSAWIKQYIKDHHPNLANKEDLISLVRGAEQ